MRIYPFERLVGYFGLFTVAAFYLLELPARTRFDFYIKQIFSAIDNYALGLCVAALFYLFWAFRAGLGERSPLESAKLGWIKFIEAFLKREALIKDLRLIFSVLLALAIFSHLKHLIPHINPALFDQQQVDLERALFGGKILSEWTIAVFGTAAAQFMSWGYTAYYIYMNAIFMVFIIYRDRRLAVEFCTAFILLWFVGALMVYSYPTWGPIFFLPELFAALPRTDATLIQEQLWVMKEYLAANPKSSEGIFLISGVPSLHIAVITLGSIYLSKLSKFVGALSWGFLALTWITTLYLGWHYLFDNIAALGLVWIAIVLSRRLNGNATT